MGEVVEGWRADAKEAAATSVDHGDTFVGFAHALHDESQRLLTLAEKARDNTQQLAEREARLVEQEHALVEAQRDLETRREEVERGARELRELAARADAAEARIAEAAEREAALNAIAHDVLQRYERPFAPEGS
jgi:chromosome segregation ATPase